MPVTRSPSRPPSGSPAYSPTDLPAYRGGSSFSPLALDPESLFQSGETGDYIDCTIQSSVLSSSVAVTADGDAFDEVTGQITDSAWDGAGVWYSNAAGTASLAGLVKDNTPPSIDTSVGFLVGYSFSFTGSNTAADDKELFFMRGPDGEDHPPPAARVVAGTSDVVIEFLSAIKTTVSGLGDGEQHTIIISYDPASDVASFYVDGALVDSQDCSGQTHVTTNLPSFVYGTRDGLEQYAWKMLYRDEPLPTAEIESFHLWLLENAVINAPLITEANVRSGGEILQVKFSGAVTSSSPSAGWSFVADGSPISVLSATVYSGVILFDLSSPLVGTEVVALSYDSEAGDVSLSGVPLQPVSGLAVNNNAADGWTPSEWFIRGEIGDWGDHSEPTGLYTNAGASMPVDTTGQAVAFMQGREGVLALSQGSAGSRPLWDSLRGLVSDGSTRTLSKNQEAPVSAYLSDGLTVVMVYSKEVSWTAVQRIIMYFGDTSSPGAHLLRTGTAAVNSPLAYHVGNTTLQYPFSSSEGFDTDTHVIAITLPAGSSNITGWLDNAAGGTVGTAGATNTTWKFLNQIQLIPDGTNDPGLLKWVIINADMSAELDKVNTWAGI